MAQHSFATFRILLVEDEENLQEALKMNLELEGYEVITASTGPEALKLYKEQRFNLFILDIMLPEMDGLHVCEQNTTDRCNHTYPVLDRQRLDPRQNSGLEKRCR
jgi:two-component system alkaline phosphatase synthesis response regulator PhoP